MKLYLVTIERDSHYYVLAASFTDAETKASKEHAKEGFNPPHAATDIKLLTAKVIK